jgi:cytochrome c-type biogenesis protein CcmH
MGFWVTTAILAALIGLTIMLGFLAGRSRRAEGDGGRREDVVVYRNQLRELDRDVARGIVAEADAERLRVEISRRMLDADRAAPVTAQATPRAARLAGIALVPVMVAVAYGIYTQIGAPGYGDLPLAQRLEAAAELRAGRPAQALAEAEMTARMAIDGAQPTAGQSGASEEDRALVARLRTVLQDRPDDLEGHRLLAISEAALGEFAAAHRAQARVIELLGDAAMPDDLVAQADLMILAAAGYVSPEAEAALERALRLDPTHQLARYFYGLMLAQTDRPDLAFRLWSQLLDEGPADAPWMPPIRAQIELLAMRAGVANFRLPPAGVAPARGPTAEDIAAMEDLSPEEQAAMIEGMVQGLAQRLSTQGGSAEDWAQLIRAYGVLGRTGAAREIWTEAQAVFGASEEQLAVVRDAARDAGVLE